MLKTFFEFISYIFQTFIGWQLFSIHNKTKALASRNYTPSILFISLAKCMVFEMSYKVAFLI